MAAGNGDKLARGLPRAQFYGPRVTQEVWDRIWAVEDESKNDSSGANVSASGNAGAQSGKATSVPGI